jgi:mRNA-degrading endonuclease toxin of MazEF toxin-antitoxin module
MRCVVDQRITPSAKAQYLGFCGWGDAFCCAETHPTFNYTWLLTDLFSAIAIRIIIPITSWPEKFVDRPFRVKILALPENGWGTDSAGNVLQVRSLSTARFRKRLGVVSSDVLNKLLAGLIVCVDYS